MARPERNTVDYFPFICDEGKKMFYIEETYGNDGFATFVKILRELAKTSHHYLDLSKKTTMMFLSAKCKIPITTLESIINDLVDLGKFDEELWVEANVIWCQDFIDSVQDAYKKRNNNCIDRKSLVVLLSSKGLIKQSKSKPKPDKSNSKVPVNPQRKEKDNKEEETIEDKSKEKYLSETKVSDDIDFTEFEDLSNNTSEEERKKIPQKKESETELYPTFDDFWDAYEKKVGSKDKVISKWDKLPQKEKEKIMEYLPLYKKSQPNKQYRKNPETFLNNKGWEDEIIFSKETAQKINRQTAEEIEGTFNTNLSVWTQ